MNVKFINGATPEMFGQKVEIDGEMYDVMPECYHRMEFSESGATKVFSLTPFDEPSEHTERKFIGGFKPIAEKQKITIPELEKELIEEIIKNNYCFLNLKKYGYDDDFIFSVAFICYDLAGTPETVRPLYEIAPAFCWRIIELTRENGALQTLADVHKIKKSILW